MINNQYLKKKYSHKCLYRHFPLFFFLSIDKNVTNNNSNGASIINIDINLTLL